VEVEEKISKKRIDYCLYLFFFESSFPRLVQKRFTCRHSGSQQNKKQTRIKNVHGM